MEELTMPGMITITPEEASRKRNCICEEKVDGTRMIFDGKDIFSDREINRNDRYPHIVKELRKLNWKVRGEIALSYGNVLQINKRDNWPYAKFYLYDLFEYNNRDFQNVTPEEIRHRINHILKHFDSRIITTPILFKSFDDGWYYTKRQNRKGKYVEGVVLKPRTGSPFKIKLLKEEKLPIIGYETGKSKGAFFIKRNGVIGKVSATSVSYVEEYKKLLQRGKKPFVEIEYQFITDDGKPYQPRLRRLNTWHNLKLSS
jgi:ATP-dependent DNA ligase